MNAVVSARDFSAEGKQAAEEATARFASTHFSNGNATHCSESGMKFAAVKNDMRSVGMRVGKGGGGVLHAVLTEQ
jgi:hypothetical protein